MTKNENKVLTNELLKEDYLKDLLVNEIYSIVPEIKDSYEFKDIMEIISRSYCLGKMRQPRTKTLFIK